MSSSHVVLAVFLLAGAIVSASPVAVTAPPESPNLDARASCPPIHVFGARETTAPPGYGSSWAVVNLILSAHPGSTAEAISYPACGGQSSCGGISYGNSALQGIYAVASAVGSFSSRCPSTKLVLVGYSQGGQIMDDALCGGGDAGAGYYSSAVPLSAAAVNMVKAAIFMGDPRHVAGLPYNVGSCYASGVRLPLFPIFSTPSAGLPFCPLRRPGVRQAGGLGLNS